MTRDEKIFKFLIGVYFFFRAWEALLHSDDQWTKGISGLVAMFLSGFAFWLALRYEKGERPYGGNVKMGKQ